MLILAVRVQRGIDDIKELIPPICCRRYPSSVSHVFVSNGWHWKSAERKCFQILTGSTFKFVNLSLIKPERQNGPTYTAAHTLLFPKDKNENKLKWWKPPYIKSPGFDLVLRGCRDLQQHGCRLNHTKLLLWSLDLLHIKNKKQKNKFSRTLFPNVQSSSGGNKPVVTQEQFKCSSYKAVSEAQSKTLLVTCVTKQEKNLNPV